MVGTGSRIDAGGGTERFGGDVEGLGHVEDGRPFVV